MFCPECNSKNTHVNTTRPTRTHTRRYCRCLDCKQTFQTIECYLKDSRVHLRLPDAVLKLPALAGTNNGAAVLTEQNIRDIRQLKKQGKTTREIAAVYGINHGHVSRIVTYKVWTHVK